MNANFLFLTFISCLFFSCSDGNDNSDVDSANSPGLGIESDIISSIGITLDPSGYAPLTAELSIETTQETYLTVSVIGQQGDASTITRTIEQQSTEFVLDILGLYADYDNQLDITLLDESGSTIETHRISLTTEPLIDSLPNVQIDVSSTATSIEFNFVNYFGFNQSFQPQRPFIFDQFGDIRWYLDFSEHPTFSDLFYDNGMTRMQNGHLVFGNGSTGNIYEIDMLGRMVNSWSLQGNGFHHHVIEKPNGNLLVTINDVSKSTIEDVVVEIDRELDEIITTWDLNESLDNTRRAWPTNRADLNEDWFHANAIEYSATDDEIIVSGRTQGIVKLNNQNEVSYILAPHREWNTSGNGISLAQFLLTPLDANDTPISDVDVLSGVSNHSDFEWSWYQHSPILLPNGNLMVFDNGENRNYIDAGPYSRAVEYQIDEENKTIKQVWSYGKERGEQTYSEIVSKVSYVAENDSILFTPGAAVTNGTPTGKVVEVDYATKNVIFEASIIPPNTVANISFHNVLRIGLYGDE